MSYLILLALIFIVLIIWLNCDNREDFGSGFYFLPYNNLNYSYYSIEDYPGIESGETFPRISPTELNESDRAIDANHFNFYSPSGSYIS